MKLIVLSFFIITNHYSLSQDTISLLSIATHIEDCALEFRSEAKKQGFRFIDYQTWERGIITEDYFIGPNSIELVKSYSPKTIIDCNGKGHKEIIYVKGRRNFNKIAYAETLQMIKVREGTAADFRELNYIELKNVPKEMAMNIKEKFIAEGATETPGCFSSEYRQYYSTVNYTACFDSNDSKDTSIFSIRLYKNYENN